MDIPHVLAFEDDMMHGLTKLGTSLPKSVAAWLRAIDQRGSEGRRGKGLEGKGDESKRGEEGANG
jgi:hypothetical protein